MLVKTLGLSATGTTAQFTDVTPDDWCYNSVNTAASAGLVSGMGNGLFAPNAPVTREQMAVMVAKALGDNAPAVNGTELDSFSDSSSVSSWAVNGMEEAVKAGIVSGMTTDTLRLGQRHQGAGGGDGLQAARRVGQVVSGGRIRVPAEKRSSGPPGVSEPGWPGTEFQTLIEKEK